jgi:transmembrane protein EpsG
MTGVRQSLAMVFLMLAYEEIKERKLVKYLVLIGVAFLFHQSSLVFLPMYWVTKKKIRKIDGMIMICIVTLMYGSRSEVFNYIKAFTSYYYFDELNHGEPINFSIMIYTAVLMTYLVCLIYQKDLRDYESENLLVYREKYSDVVRISNYTNILYFAAIFMPMVAVNGSVRRIVMYFAVFMIFSIPEVINRMFTEQSAQFVKIVLSALLLFLMLKGVSGSSYHYSLSLF